MSEEAAFLRAICENPDEDTPRLVFADWLDELGGEVNTNWAELIRVQVPLARGPGADRERLVARDRELEPLVVAAWPKRIGAREDRVWIGGTSAGLNWQNWTRGFPLTLAGPGAMIRGARPAFAGRVPLREFNIKPATDADLVEFVTWPELALVRKLGVWGETGTINERGLLALAGCEHLKNLERLRMEWVAYTNAAVEALLDSPHLGNLTSPKIRGYGFSNLSEDVQQRVHERFGRWTID